MAGGIFPNYPFEVNAKCVIFSIIVIGLFFYSPPKMNNYWKSFTGFLLFVFAYVLMAWYDYKFECQKLALKKGTSPYGITGQLKPPAHTESQIDSSKMTQKEKSLEWTLINILHLLIISPLFLYVGINKNESHPTTNILLIASFSFAILYHGFRFARNFNIPSAAHIIISIIGIYYSLLSEKPLWFYNSLMSIGIYAGLSHGLYLTQLYH